MCFGYSKEPSHRDGSFEYPQHMFWLRNKKISYALLSGGLLCFMRYQKHSLVCAFVIRFLKSMISKLALYIISKLYLVSVAEQVDLNMDSRFSPSENSKHQVCIDFIIQSRKCLHLMHPKMKRKIYIFYCFRFLRAI